MSTVPAPLAIFACTVAFVLVIHTLAALLLRPYIREFNDTFDRARRLAKSERDYRLLANAINPAAHYEIGIIFAILLLVISVGLPFIILYSLVRVLFGKDRFADPAADKPKPKLEDFYVVDPRTWKEELGFDPRETGLWSEINIPRLQFLAFLISGTAYPIALVLALLPGLASLLLFSPLALVHSMRRRIYFLKERFISLLAHNMRVP